MSTTPILGLTEHAEGGSGGRVLANIGLRALEQRLIHDFNVNVPTGSEDDGTLYTVGATGSGDFTGWVQHSLALLVTDSATQAETWVNLTPTEGMFFRVKSTSGTWASSAAFLNNSGVWAEWTGGSSTDSNAIHVGSAAEIVAIAEKAVPASADVLVIEDSADSNNKKRVEIGNLPGGTTLPADDATVIVENGSGHGVVIDCTAMTADRTITAPDTDLDLTPNTGTYPAAAHTTRHQSGGADAIALDTLGATTDITTLDSSGSAHGLLPKLSGTSTEFLNGSGAWTTPSGSAPPSNLSATTDPTGTDDTPTYSVGSIWINTTTDRAWICLDSTSTAAVWSPTSLPAKDSSALAADASDQTKRMRIDCGNVTAGQTRVLSMPDANKVLQKDNLAATTAPGTGNDDSQDYSIGSRWFDTTADKEYVCLDAGTGAAVWTETTGAGGGGISNVVEDTTPQLGGHLDVNGQAIGDGTRELLTFVEDGSAINQIEIENEAAGSGPIIRSTGDDTNVDLNLDCKGSGAINAGAVLAMGANAITTSSTVDGVTVSAHATRHATGGADAIKLDDLATPDDNTDLDATTGVHGLLPKLGGGTTNFLRADGTWNAPAGGGSGDVVGPAIATDNALARFDSTTGKLIQDGPVLVGDAGAMSGLTTINGSGGREILTFTDDGSAINHVQIENEATGAGPIVSAVGDNTDVDLNLQGKGAGKIAFQDGSDPTKRLDHDVTAITTGTTRTVTWPDADKNFLQDNLSASVSPGTGNDDSQGYAVGSVWIDVTGTDTAWICADASTGVANWIEMGSTSALYNVVEDASPTLGGPLDVDSNAIFNGSGATVQVNDDFSVAGNIAVTGTVDGHDVGADLRKALFFAAPRVLEYNQATTPGAPSDGDAYHIAAGATGAFSTHANEIARWTDATSAWEYFTDHGQRVAVRSAASHAFGGMTMQYDADEDAWFPTQDQHTTTAHWTGRHSQAGNQIWRKSFAGSLTDLSGGGSQVVAHGVTPHSTDNHRRATGCIAANNGSIGVATPQNFSSIVFELRTTTTNIQIFHGTNLLAYGYDIDLEYVPA